MTLSRNFINKDMSKSSTLAQIIASIDLLVDRSFKDKKEHFEKCSILRKL